MGWPRCLPRCDKPSRDHGQTVHRRSRCRKAKKSLSKLWQRGIGFSVDLLGEACVRDAEADVYLQRYLDMIEGLAGIASTWEPNDRLDQDHIESVPRANVSVKISSLSATLDPIDTEGSIRDCCSGCVPSCKRRPNTTSSSTSTWSRTNPKTSRWSCDGPANWKTSRRHGHAGLPPVRQRRRPKHD